MLQTTLSVFKPRGTSSAGKIVLGAIGALTGYGALYHYNQYLNLSSRWKQIQESVAHE